MTSSSLDDMIRSEFIHVFPGHETDLRNKLYEQWQENQCCDLTIALKGGELHAHSCVLAAFSPKLKVIVDNLKSETEKEKVIHLTFQESVFQCLLNVMYTGALSFNAAMLSSVLSTARWLQMDEIIKLCQEYKEVMGETFTESKMADDSVLTEVNAESDRDEEISFCQEENSFCEEENSLCPTGSSDKFPERKTRSRNRKKGLKRGRPPKTVSSSPRRSQRKSRQGSIPSPVTVKVEIEEIEETDSGIKLNDPVDSTPTEITMEVGLQPETFQGPKQKSEPAKGKETHASEQKLTAATPLLTQVKTENPLEEIMNPPEVIDSSLMTHIQWVETQVTHGEEETDFAMGKSNHIRCKKCLVKFTDLEKYLCHVTDHPSFKCDHCDVTYYRLSNLTRHMRTSHSSTHHLQCKKCDFVAGTESMLRKHFKEVHGGDKPFICSHPGCTYSSCKIYFLRRHLEIHSEVKRYMCNKCGQGFAQHAGLVSHEFSCYSLQQYLCDLCGQAFNHLQSMRAHRRTIHFGEKPYLCKVCGNQFSDNRNLKRHMRIHENSFPYQCPVCKQNYRHSNSLKAHLKKHEKDGVSITVNMMKAKESAQKKRAARRNKAITIGPGELSGNGDDSALGGSEFEKGCNAGSGKTVTETVFPMQSSPTSASETLDTSAVTLSSSEVRQAFDVADAEVVNGEKIVEGSCNVLKQLGFNEKTSTSDLFTAVPLQVTDQNADPEASSTAVLHQTPVSFSDSQSVPENFLLASSFDSRSGTTVIKVELLNESSSTGQAIHRSSESDQDVEDFGGAENAVRKEHEKAERDKDTKGQSSYGLQTLAEICFSSSV